MERNRAAAMESGAAITVLVLISTRVVGGPGKGLLQLIPALTTRKVARPLLCTFRHAMHPDTPFAQAARERGIELAFVDQRFNLDWRALPQLRRLVQTRAVDVIQTHGYKEDLFGLLLKLATGKPWICFLHGTTDENLKVRLYHALEAALVRFADRIVAVSHELAARIVRGRALARVTVVENAVSPEAAPVSAFELAVWRRRYQVQRANVIVCVGRLSPEKGQDVLLEAAALLRDRGVRFQLLLVGDGPARDGLARRTIRLGLGANVAFLGVQTRMDIVYAAADVLVLPSRKEGMPNVVLEAMQQALPVVATRVGAVPAMLRDGIEALIVPPGEPRALAQALITLLADPLRARSLGRAARQALYPRFSPEWRTEQMERLYQEVLKGT